MTFLTAHCKREDEIRCVWNAQTVCQCVSFFFYFCIDKTVSVISRSADLHDYEICAGPFDEIVMNSAYFWNAQLWFYRPNLKYSNRTKWVRVWGYFKRSQEDFITLTSEQRMTWVSTTPRTCWTQLNHKVHCFSLFDVFGEIIVHLSWSYAMNSSSREIVALPKAILQR